MNTRAAKTLNVSEQQQLLDSLLNRHGYQHCHSKSIRNYAMACLMLDAGLRVGEVVQLLIDDLVFNNSPVTNIVIRPEISKNHKERSIPVSSRLSAVIVILINSYWPKEANNLSLLAFYNKNATQPLTTRQVERIISAAGLKSLGRPVHPHMLRHTFASKLMRITDMRTVQELLGHSSITSTQIYTHPNEDDKRNAISELNSSVPAESA